jgi:hypothetical protein
MGTKASNIMQTMVGILHNNTDIRQHKKNSRI